MLESFYEIKKRLEAYCKNGRAGLLIEYVIEYN